MALQNPGRPTPSLLRSQGQDDRSKASTAPTRTIKVIKQSGYFMSPKSLTEEEIDDLTERYVHKFYNESACAKCDLYKEGSRHCDTCDSCSAFQGEVALAGLTTIKTKAGDDTPIVKAPLGQPKKFIKWLKHNNLVPQVIDKQVTHNPIDPFNFVREPYPYQVEAVDAGLLAEKGILSSPPRTGKTAMGALAVHRLQQKTLVLAHQREWLENFMATFIGNDDEPAFTDIDPARVGFCKTYEDFVKHDICFATFQQFFKPKGMALFERIVKLFPICIVDECQYAPAPESVKLMSKVISKYRIGMSGSAQRKDQRHVIFADQVGPTFFQVKAQAMTPTVIPFETNMHFKIWGSGPGAFTRFRSSMEKSKKRVAMIVKIALRCAEQGHFVIIPVGLTKTIKTLVDEINEAYFDSCPPEKDDGVPIARGFHGALNKVDRKQVIEDARKYKYKIMVANIALISTGVNIPRASCLIDGVTPTSNLPKAQQRFSRVLTPDPSKPDPLIVYLLDTGSVKGMRRNEYYNCLLKHFKPNVSPKHKQVFATYFKDEKKFNAEDY